jgi:voltage-gated potassium channel
MSSEYTKYRGLSRWVLWKPARFVQLFLLIIFVILVSPFLERNPILLAVLAVFFLNLLLVTLSSAGFSLWRLWLLLVFWLLWILLGVASHLTENPSAAKTFSVFSGISETLLLVMCVFQILRFVLKSQEVTVDTIFAAFVAYFLIAFAFSAIYHAAATIEPASFSMPDRWERASGLSPKMDFSYFSFVTITTLGYGDIVPRMPVTQVLAILEAVTGQFYMAVVVAWLVSVLAGSRRGAGGKGGDSHS